MTADQFLRKLVHGGHIVGSAACTVEELADARARGDVYAPPEPGTAWAYGFVYLPATRERADDEEPAPATVDPD